MNYPEKEYFKHQAENDRMWEEIKNMRSIIERIAKFDNSANITTKVDKQCVKAVLLTLLSKWQLEDIRDIIYSSQNTE